MKKINKKAFTLIELLVVVAVIGILVLLAAPRFIGQTNKAQDRNIQNDVKVAEMKVSETLIDGLDMWDSWTDDGVTSGTLKTLIGEDGTGTTLYGRGGPIYDENDVEDGGYRVLPETFIKQEIRSRLEGTFYANDNGTVYYESGVVRQGEADKKEPSKPGQPSEPGEKEPGYSDEEIQGLINEGYIPIATAEELNSIRNSEKQTYGEGTKWKKEYEGGLDKKYVQVANIDLLKYSEKVEGWNPIGTDAESSFTGTYDGGNYVITGLETKGGSYQGLFGRTEGATIRNVGLIDNKVIGIRYLGGLVGVASDSTMISNSYATGSVTGTGSTYAYSGGLVGFADSGATISNSYATGSVTGSSDYVGGLVGYAGPDTMIENSYATGSVKGRTRTGGLVGRAYESTIENSYATGKVTGRSLVGGLAGEAQDGTKISNSYATGEVEGTDYAVGGLVGNAPYRTTISNSYATGSVKGAEYSVGGLVGLASSSTKISNSYATGSVEGTGTGSGSYAGYWVGGLVGWADKNIIIENSYATGSVTGTGSNVGGLVGRAEISTIGNSYATGPVKGRSDVGGLVGWADSDNTVTNSYWDKDTTEQSSSAAGGTGKTTEEMKKLATYLDWSFDTVWEIDERDDYPKLR